MVELEPSKLRTMGSIPTIRSIHMGIGSPGDYSRWERLGRVASFQVYG